MPLKLVIVSVANDYVPSSDLLHMAEPLRGGQPAPSGPRLPVRLNHRRLGRAAPRPVPAADAGAARL